MSKNNFVDVLKIENEFPINYFEYYKISYEKFHEKSLKIFASKI